MKANDPTKSVVIEVVDAFEKFAILGAIPE